MTSVVEFAAWSSIRHEARKWLIRMDGDAPLSDAERQMLRAWMRRSTQHRQELIRLVRFWNDADVLALDLDSSFRRLLAADLRVAHHPRHGDEYSTRS